VSQPNPPRPGDDAHVPDSVLDELSAAFGAADDPVSYDFDDPSIDRLLGLGPDVEPPAAPPVAPPVESPVESPASTDAVVLPFRSPRAQQVSTESAGEEPVQPHQPDVAHPTDRPEVPDQPDEAEVGGARRTIVIADDGQPDTVYLDEEKEERFRAVHGDGTSDRSTIVISDLDDGAVSQQPPTASGGSIDPRVRARRISVRRAEGRRRLVWVAVGVVALLLVVGAVAVVASPIFGVEEVRVQGATYTDQQLIADIVAELEGEPVLLVDTEALEARLQRDPWVERARVSTDFPHTVVIDIRERVPLATFQGGDGSWRVIDVQGRVLAVLEGQPISMMPIDGEHPDTTPGQFAGAPYADAALLVRSLPGEIRVLTRAVVLDSAVGTMSLLLSPSASASSEDPVVVRLGDAENLDAKLVRLLGQVRSGLEGVASLDVSTEEIGVVPR